MVPLFWVLVAGSLGALLWFLQHHSWRYSGGSTKKVPPGSMGWPLLGHTLEFMARNPIHELEPFIKNGKLKYGGLFRADFFGRRTIVSTHLDVNKFVLQNEGRLFRTNLPKSLRDMLGEFSLLALTGNEHKLFRGVIVNFLGAWRSKLGSMLHDIEICAMRTMESWKDNSLVHFHGETKRFTFEVISKALMSLPLKETHEIMEFYKPFSVGILSLPIKIPGTKYSMGLKGRANLVKYFQKVLDARRRQPQNQLNDMLDFILAEEVKEGKRFSDEHIQDFFVTVFFAGHDTSAKALAAIVKLLTDSPESLQELLKEHDAIRKAKQGDERLNMEDYQKMSFTQNVINEALRIINLSLGVHRIALEDVELKDYIIPKGWNVFVSFSASHFDQNVFPDPSVFDPFRWQAMKPPPTSHLMPFGGGIRLCPAADLARLEIAVFLHHFLTQYSWEQTEPDELIHNPVFGIVKGLPIRVKSRNKYRP